MAYVIKPIHNSERVILKNMARLVQSVGVFYVLFVLYFISFNGSCAALDEDRKMYIVYMGSLPDDNAADSPSDNHISILREVVDNRFAEKSLVRSYKRSFNGFAAYLTTQEKDKIAERDDVVLIFPSQMRQLHTTASWDFMHFNPMVHRRPEVERDIIIGVIDTGIWPESKSFDDTGLGPPPEKWKGACEGGKNFTCNNKIIGARYYVSEVRRENSSRDYFGHGSHTASTAAGRMVPNASFYGLGKGNARGAVPSTRIAAYKVCGESGCSDDAVLAAFDDAIADGVDVLSLSLGADMPLDMKQDTIAIGSFHAHKEGILTVQSAGNRGNGPGRITSLVPWLFTVAASTISRKFVAPVVLGNGKILDGNGVNAFELNGTQFPIAYGHQASKNCSDFESQKCRPGCMHKDLVEGKILVCNTSNPGFAFYAVYRTGAVGVIFVQDTPDSPMVTPCPSSAVTSQQMEQLVDYIKSTTAPTGNLLKSKAIKDVTAPNVASFSSRGPSFYFPDILKPDITAPGDAILAAYSPAISPSGLSDLDHRSVDYSIISGTSMSCPHVTGAAAYVKSINPCWSPSAIKSALMTTAWKMNATDSYYGDAEFSYGAGHLDPGKAAFPGLVYETSHTDYIKWICGKNISGDRVNKITGFNVNCSGVSAIKDKDLNYPTMSAKVKKGDIFTVTFRRTVKNVGPNDSNYYAKITKNSPYLDVKVEPNTLSFDACNKIKSFAVTVAGTNFEGFASASLEWLDGRHNVRSPIVVFTDSPF